MSEVLRYDLRGRVATLLGVFFLMVFGLAFWLGEHHHRRPLIECYVEAYNGDLVTKGCELIP